MKNSIIATAALAAVASASTIGSAIVLNHCDYDVYLYNTPSADGGYSTISKVLSSGGSYSQVYTPLTNGNGWSMKLSTSTDLSNIMQYEYTFSNDGTIWYDLSDVDGNPWDGNWEITSDLATCTPRQAAYRYSTDDAYGEQSCPQAASITVTLCSGDDTTGSSSSSVTSVTSVTSTSSQGGQQQTSSAAPQPTSESAATTTLVTSVVTKTATATQTQYTSKNGGGGGHNFQRDAHQHIHARHPHGHHA